MLNFLIIGMLVLNVCKVFSGIGMDINLKAKDLDAELIKNNSRDLYCSVTLVSNRTLKVFLLAPYFLLHPKK